MLDRLPTWARYLILLAVIAPIATFAGAIALEVVTAHGVFAVAWADTTKQSVDAAAVTCAGGITTWIALFITPLTKKFGVGKGEDVPVLPMELVDPVPEPPEPEHPPVDLASLTKAQLQTALADLGLSQSGTKAALIARLKAAK